MTARAPVGVHDAELTPVADEAYPEALLGLIAGAREFLVASVFIVDVNAHEDPDAKVIGALRSLRDVAWRGVDVRLLIGSSHDNIAIGEACHIARAYARELGLACRLLAAEGRRGSHAKFVVNESSTLCGSHNWSLGSFGGQVQDSVLIGSPALAVYMRELFETQWQRATEEP